MYIEHLDHLLYNMYIDDCHSHTAAYDLLYNMYIDDCYPHTAAYEGES